MKPMLILVLFLAFASNVYSETIYKSYDKNGTPIYSDREPKSKYEIIKKTSDKKATAIEEEVVDPIPAERTMETIRTTTNSVQDDINSLYEALYKSNNGAKGEVKVPFTIDQKGKVTDCTEDETGMSITGFNGKICEKLSTLDYGEVEQEKPTKVNWVYKFYPLEEQ